jgi:hypothetical protein
MSIDQEIRRAVVQRTVRDRAVVRCSCHGLTAINKLVVGVQYLTRRAWSWPPKHKKP